MKYAGFWIRVVAALIDGFLLMIVVWPFYIYVLGISMSTMTIFSKSYFSMVLLGLAIGWLYSAGMESSKYQGTLGKMAVSIKVTDMNGKRISFGKATARFFSKYLSAVILYIGYFMIAFTKKKQGLHDLIANTLVVKKAASKK